MYIDFIFYDVLEILRGSWVLRKRSIILRKNFSILRKKSQFSLRNIRDFLNIEDFIIIDMKFYFGNDFFVKNDQNYHLIIIYDLCNFWYIFELH